jgi:hypothetical protein
MSQSSELMLTKEDGTPVLDKEPEDPSDNVSLNALTSPLAERILEISFALSCL